MKAFVENSDLSFRADPRPSDRDAIREIVGSTGYFRPDEIEVAVELLDERIARGMDSGYHFLFAEAEAETVGYACYGPIACTLTSYDLYWIAVRDTQQGRGFGQRILRKVEECIRSQEGTRVYIETSGREDYAPTQSFYRRCGYRLEAELADFYAPGDARLTFVRVLDDEA